MKKIEDNMHEGIIELEDIGKKHDSNINYSRIPPSEIILEIVEPFEIEDEKSKNYSKVEPEQIKLESSQIFSKVPSEIIEKDISNDENVLVNNPIEIDKKSFFQNHIKIILITTLFLLILIGVTIFLILYYSNLKCNLPNCKGIVSEIFINNKKIVFKQNMRIGDSFFLNSTSTYESTQESNKTDINNSTLVKNLLFSVYNTTIDTFCYFAILKNTTIITQQNNTNILGFDLFNTEIIKKYKDNSDPLKSSNLKKDFGEFLLQVEKSYSEYKNCLSKNKVLDSVKAHENCINNALTLPYIKYCRHYDGKILFILKPKLINKFQWDYLFAEIFDFSPKISLDSFTTQIKNNTKIRLLTSSSDPNLKGNGERSFSYDNGAKIEEIMKTDSFEVDNLKFNKDTNLTSKSQIELDPDIGSVKNLKLKSNSEFKNVISKNNDENANDTESFDKIAKKDDKASYTDEIKTFSSNMEKSMTTEQIIREEFFTLELMKIIENYMEYDEIPSEIIVNKNGRRILQSQYRGISEKYPIPNEIDHPELFGRHLLYLDLPKNLRPVDFKTNLDSVILMGSKIEFFAQNTFYPNEDSMVNNVVAKFSGKERIIHNSKKDEIGISKSIKKNNYFLNLFNQNLNTIFKNNFDDTIFSTKNTFSQQAEQIYDVVKHLKEVESLKQEALKSFSLEMQDKLEKNFTNFKQNFINVAYSIQNYLTAEKKKDFTDLSDKIILKDFIDFNKINIELDSNFTDYINKTFYIEIDYMLNNITRIYPTLFFTYSDLITKIINFYNNIEYSTNSNIKNGVFKYFNNKTTFLNEKYQNKTNSILKILLNFQLLKSIVSKQENLESVKTIESYPQLIFKDLNSLEKQITRDKQYPKLFTKSRIFDSFLNDTLLIKNIFDEKFLNKFSKFEKLNGHKNLFIFTANKTFFIQDTENYKIEVKKNENILLKFDKSLTDINNNLLDFEIKQYLNLIKIYQDIKTNFTAEILRTNNELNDLLVYFTEIKEYFTNVTNYIFIQDEVKNLFSNYSSNALNNLNLWLDSLSDTLTGHVSARMIDISAANNVVGKAFFCRGFDDIVQFILNEIKTYYNNFNNNTKNFIFSEIMNLKSSIMNKFTLFQSNFLNYSNYSSFFDKFPQNRKAYRNGYSEIIDKIENFFLSINHTYDAQVLQEDMKRESAYTSKTTFINNFKIGLINSYGINEIGDYHWGFKDKQRGYGLFFEHCYKLLNLKNQMINFDLGLNSFNFTQNFYSLSNDLKLKADNYLNILKDRLMKIISKLKLIESELTTFNADFIIFKSKYDEILRNFSNIYFGETIVEEYLNEHFDNYFKFTYDFVNEFIKNKKLKNINELSTEVRLKIPNLSFLTYIHKDLTNLLLSTGFNKSLDIHDSTIDIISKYFEQNFEIKLHQIEKNFKRFLKNQITVQDFYNHAFLKYYFVEYYTDSQNNITTFYNNQIINFKEKIKIYKINYFNTEKYMNYKLNYLNNATNELNFVKQTSENSTSLLIGKNLSLVDEKKFELDNLEVNILSQIFYLGDFYLSGIDNSDYPSILNLFKLNCLDDLKNYEDYIISSPFLINLYDFLKNKTKLYFDFYLPKESALNTYKDDFKLYLNDSYLPLYNNYLNSDSFLDLNISNFIYNFAEQKYNQELQNILNFGSFKSLVETTNITLDYFKQINSTKDKILLDNITLNFSSDDYLNSLEKIRNYTSSKLSEFNQKEFGLNFNQTIKAFLNDFNLKMKKDMIVDLINYNIIEIKLLNNTSGLQSIYEIEFLNKLRNDLNSTIDQILEIDFEKLNKIYEINLSQIKNQLKLISNDFYNFLEQKLNSSFLQEIEHL